MKRVFLLRNKKNRDVYGVYKTPDAAEEAMSQFLVPTDQLEIEPFWLEG